jgi:DNA-binding GntR family transcriptional regulator
LGNASDRISVLSIKYRYSAKLTVNSRRSAILSKVASTRTAEVYDVLRSELLNGVICPGQRLRLVELASRFSVSQSVIREALTRLAEQGFVVATPQRGFRVRELSVEDIAGLTEARVEVESGALRLAIERGDVRWETGILATHHILERTATVRDDGTVNEEWATNHREFHRALLAGCGNPRLEAIAQAWRDNDFVAEHRQLKDLALARDGDAAIELLAEHIEWAPRQLIAYAREHGIDSFHEP